MNDQAAGRSSVAVLMTCHNRRDLTLRCLGSLTAQEADGADLTVFLVDDGSTDGTSLAVHAEYPDVHVIGGSGQLFWTGGMRLAQQAALLSDPDYLLWLNDDVRLEDDAIAVLLETHRRLCARGIPDAIVVGATKDPDAGVTAYSGVVRRNRIRRVRFMMLEPTREPIPCDTMSGNVVLVPRSVHARVGALDPAFAHGLSDFDYGLRARAKGCEVWIAPGHLGTCELNRTDPAGLDDSFPFRERLRYLLSPRGLPPREWLRYTRRHGGVFWMGAFVAPYVRFIGRAAVSLGRTDSAHGE